MTRPVHDTDLLRIVRRIRLCEDEAAALVLLTHAVRNYQTASDDSGRLLDEQGEPVIEERLGSDGFFPGGGVG